MTEFKPRNPDFERRVRDSFARQRVMHTIGATLTRIEPGVVEITLPFRDDLTQQHGYTHAGIVGTIADSAGGYAGFSLMPPGSTVLSVEYRMHLLAPARGEKLVARGQVVRSGRTLTVCELKVEAVTGAERSTCAIGTQTLICLPEGEDRPAG
ncbi:MAG: PaaI family thioesterase [Gaiellaceae bacterium]